MAEVLTLKQAASMLEVSEQAVREMIKAGYFGACWGSEKHRNYYVTDAQIKNFKEGATNEGK